GTVAGQTGVPPGPVVALGVEEVQRQELRLVLGPIARPMLDRLADAAVQASPATVRKPFVGGVPDQRVLELQLARTLSSKEVRQPPERGPPREALALQHLPKELRLEAHPEDRRVPKDRPVAGGQAVDLRRHQALDRARKPLHAPRAAGG